jgi:Flp pilus assembly protein TadD
MFPIPLSPPRRGPARLWAATALALVLTLAACAGAVPPDVRATDGKAAMLLKVADDTRAGGDPATALSLYRQLHAQQPSDPVPLRRIGATALELHEYTDAASAYRSALKLTPNDADSHRGLALVLLALNQPDAALVELRAALAQRGDDARSFNALGIAHDLMGRYDLAQQDYRNGLKLAPGNAGLCNNYGMSLALAGEYPQAIDLLKEVADAPDAPPRYRLNLALAYGLAGDDQKATATARQVLDEASVKNNLAYYALLRAMDPKARTAAVLGAQLHGAALPAAASAPATMAAPAPAHVDATPLPPVAASPTAAPTVLTPPPPPPSPAAAAPASPPAVKPPSAAIAPSHDFFVQLGSFSLERTAQRVADGFTAKGVRVRVVPSHDPEGRVWFTVRSDDFVSAEGATAALHQIEAIGGVEPVLRQRHTPLPMAVASTV